MDHMDVFLMEMWTLQGYPRSHRLDLIPCYYIMTCAEETFNCKIIKQAWIYFLLEPFNQDIGLWEAGVKQRSGHSAMAR